MINNAVKSKATKCELNLLFQLSRSLKVIEGERMMVFGATVIKCDDNGHIIERVTVDNITSDFKKALQFIDLITRCSVTPCSLFDVAEDFVNE